MPPRSTTLHPTMTMAKTGCIRRVSAPVFTRRLNILRFGLLGTVAVAFILTLSCNGENTNIRHYGIGPDVRKTKNSLRGREGFVGPSSFYYEAIRELKGDGSSGSGHGHSQGGSNGGRSNVKKHSGGHSVAEASGASEESPVAEENVDNNDVGDESVESEEKLDSEGSEESVASDEEDEDSEESVVSVEDDEDSVLSESESEEESSSSVEESLESESEEEVGVDEESEEFESESFEEGSESEIEESESPDDEELSEENQMGGDDGNEPEGEILPQGQSAMTRSQSSKSNTKAKSQENVGDDSPADEAGETNDEDEGSGSNNDEEEGDETEPMDDDGNSNETPETPEPEANDGGSSTQPDDDFTGIDDEIGEIEAELHREEKVARGLGSLGFFLAIGAMIFTAHQMSENPDGFYARYVRVAGWMRFIMLMPFTQLLNFTPPPNQSPHLVSSCSVCRLAITLSGCALKIVFMPCRKLMGTHHPHYHGHMPVSTVDYGYREPYRGNGNSGFELS